MHALTSGKFKARCLNYSIFFLIFRFQSNRGFFFFFSCPSSESPPFFLAFETTNTGTQALLIPWFRAGFFPLDSWEPMRSCYSGSTKKKQFFGKMSVDAHAAVKSFFRALVLWKAHFFLVQCGVHMIGDAMILCEPREVKRETQFRLNS